MQGGYEKTAKVMRQILALRDDALLDGVLAFTETHIEPMTPNFVRDTCELIRARFGDEHSASTVSSTIKTTLPVFLGLEFTPYVAKTRGPGKTSDRVDALEARVAALEEKMQELLPLLN